MPSVHECDLPLIDFTMVIMSLIAFTDEMGLGKTVELLACIFSHRKSASEDDIFIDSQSELQKSNIKRLKRERVECICGAVSESRKYEGLWVQCDICDAWQHADCVGYSPERKLKSGEVSGVQQCEKKSMIKSKGYTRRKKTANIAMRDGEHICPLCLELMHATESPLATGATLIVCPAPILPQWHAEIIRYSFFLNCTPTLVKLDISCKT